MSEMDDDPFETGNVSSLGTFKGAYYDDDATAIGSDDLTPSPTPAMQTADASTTWVAVLVGIPVAIVLIVLAGLLFSYL
jgi:hypothetical protein